MLGKLVFLAVLAFFTLCLLNPVVSVHGQKRLAPFGTDRSTLNVDSAAQNSVRLYPSVIRVQKGKTKTITAAAYDANNQPVFNAAFAFTLAGSPAVALSPALISGDDISTPLPAPPNLRTVSGITAGTTTVTATWNGMTSAPATIIVDDPYSTPTSIIHGDNDLSGGTSISTTVGEAVEINADSSQGVDNIEWNWGDGDRTTNLLSATHAFLMPGTYSLTLKVTNANGQTSSSAATVYVSGKASPTRIINVSTIPELLAAYNSATGGEHIVIPAGTILNGEIVLPAREFNDYVTIRSSASMPDVTTRVSANERGLVTIRGTYGNAVPLIIRNGASKIRLEGLKFEPKYIPDTSGPSTYYLVQIGEVFTQTDVSQNPSKIVLEHCVVNPPDDVSVVHAVLNDGYKVSIISSWLGNIRTFGSQDSQAVASFDGRGAHVYNNTFFEATAENVMYGGVVPKINGLTASDIEFRRCYFSKRLSWRVYNGESHPLNVKNLLETKNARRVYMEGSILENHWDALRSQLFALVFKSGTSPGSWGEFVPWAISEDIVLENNKVSHIYGGMTSSVDVDSSFRPYFGLKPNNIVLKNNLVDDLSQRWGSPISENGARFLQPNNLEDLRVDHVSVIDRDRTAGTSINFVSNNNYRFSVTNSIFGLGGYGIIGSGVSIGIRALNPGTSGISNGCVRDKYAEWGLAGNVMPYYGNDVSCYPTQSRFRNSYPSDYASVGFTDLYGGNYALTPSSPYKGRAADGTDPGVNVTILDERTACTLSGETALCVEAAPSPTITVSGQVVDQLQRPSAKTLVTMTGLNGEKLSALTNPFGYYSIEGVGPGQYAFKASGKAGTAESVQMVDDGANVVNLFIHP
jgi:PKD repeat protein